MTWTPAQNALLGQPIAERSTSKKTALGTIMSCKDPTYGAGEFIYLKGGASVAEKSWVTYERETHAATLLAANAIGPVAIAMAATTASYYGWFQISGLALGKCLTLMASTARVWITATGGSVDDTSVAGDGVNLARSEALTAVGSGFTTFSINRPFVNDRTSHS